MTDLLPGQTPDSTIPNDVARLAAMYPLGYFFKAYRAEERRRALLIGCPLIILGPPILCAGLTALFMLSYAISEQMGLRGLNNAPQMIAGVIALIIMVVFASVAIPAGWKINASGTIVYLFQHGIIYRKGTQTTLLFWQQITHAQLTSAFRYRPTMFEIKTVDRHTLTLHSVRDLRELAGRIQQAIAHRQLPRN